MFEEIYQKGARPELGVVDDQHTPELQFAGGIIPVDHRHRKSVSAVDQDQIKWRDLKGRQRILGPRSYEF